MGQAASSTPLSEKEIASTRDALARGMRLLTFSSVKPSHVGEECLVMTHRPDGGVRIPPPPPPPGMVQVVGQAVFYRGQLDNISPDSLTVRAAYPTAGNYKRVELQREEIQSIHLAP